MAKTKKYLKDNKMCFFFQNSTEKASDWLSSEQIVASENLTYYKVNTLSAQKIFKSSKHRFKTRLVTGTTSFLRQKSAFLKFKRLTFSKISNVFTFLAIKVNNTIYSTEQLKNLCVFYYQLVKLSTLNFIISSIKIKNLLDYSK